MMTPKPLAALLLTAVGLAAPALAAEVELRTYPAGRIWTQEVDPARGYRNLVLQNLAIVNHGRQPVAPTSLRLEVMRGDEVIEQRMLPTARLDAAAKKGAALAQSGMLAAVDFQFAPKQLLGDGVTLGDERQLAPGQALLVGSQLLTYQGAADHLRLRAEFDGGSAELSVALESGTAPGHYRSPLSGRWYVGAASTPHSHHRWAVPEEFAHDLIRLGGDGGTHRGTGAAMRDYYAYGQPVHATADGTVVTVESGQPDNVAMLRGPEESNAEYNQRLLAGQGELLAKGTAAVAGNHVIIRHADGIFSVYAHLAPGSLKVKAGEAVKAGQVLAAVGGSGNSTEPHLHFQLCDAPDALHCAGIPVHFDDATLLFGEERELQTGDVFSAP
jgi:murein DD-endopeptidase MepM/ murein hydrolase activator NlpD